MAYSSPTASTFITRNPRSTSMCLSPPMRKDKHAGGHRFHFGKYFIAAPQTKTHWSGKTVAMRLGKSRNFSGLSVFYNAGFAHLEVLIHKADTESGRSRTHRAGAAFC